eukprot:TRINITY_DN1430_c0_g1_i4.p1 TRINITY_DN1430_c0_g1~~TRINITY_DN1430_c0_g1_i4.p1  ORF type:complete len:614 (-),score=75.75 TRINITY_DN1430_c0_g1_i4:61-1902(-)
MEESLSAIIRDIGGHYARIVTEFKVEECRQMQASKDGERSCFNGKICFYYHSSEERRRPVFEKSSSAMRYCHLPCSQMRMKGSCTSGDSCQFSHNKFEQNYHPFTFKLSEPPVDMDPEFQGMPPFLIPYRLREDRHPTMEQLERIKFFLQFKSTQPKPQPPPKTMPIIPVPVTPAENGADIRTFKTRKCNIAGNHNFKRCPFYHSQDRRRDPTVYFYKCEKCEDHHHRMQQPDSCPFAHNKVEELYHPDRYRFKYCNYFPHNLDECEYGNVCSFAHSDKEINPRIELLHLMPLTNDFYRYKYKTVNCPFGYDHDRAECVYAHNPQDMRRDPLKYDYTPEKCPFWDNKSDIKRYEDGGCKDGMRCRKSHGRKEADFYPSAFRTIKCPQRCKKRDCPFLHDEQRDDCFAIAAGIPLVNHPRNAKEIMDRAHTTPNTYTNDRRISTTSLGTAITLPQQYNMAEPAGNLEEQDPDYRNQFLSRQSWEDMNTGKEVFSASKRSGSEQGRKESAEKTELTRGCLTPLLPSRHNDPPLNLPPKLPENLDFEHLLQSFNPGFLPFDKNSNRFKKQKALVPFTPKDIFIGIRQPNLIPKDMGDEEEGNLLVYVSLELSLIHI